MLNSPYEHSGGVYCVAESVEFRRKTQIVKFKCRRCCDSQREIGNSEYSKVLREENLRDRHYEKVRFDVCKTPSDLQWWINKVETRCIIVSPLRDKKAADNLCPTDRLGDTEVPLLGPSLLHGRT